jgi:hypothetical protein
MTVESMRSPEAPEPESHPERLLAILANEHASLSTTRALAWGDSSSRIGSFLSALGAGSVAIALVGGATDFRPAGFLPFTAIVLTILVVLGVTAYLRLVQINVEDATLVGAMNRIRAGYLSLEPGAARYLSTDAHDDAQGALRSLTLGMQGPVGGSQVVQAMVTAPATVGILDAVVAGLLAGCLALMAGFDTLAAIAVGMIVAFATFGLLVFWMFRAWDGLIRSVDPRFPTPPDAAG